MKRAKPERKPPLAVVEDPFLRLDIAAKRVLERVMTEYCKDPALIALYSRLKPGIEEALTEVLGPMKTRRKRVT
jgi:hypothetical protein